MCGLNVQFCSIGKTKIVSYNIDIMSKYFDNSSKNLFMEPKVTQYGSHMVMTDVVPPSKVKYINIDTRYRDDYDPSKVADYNITLPERLTDITSIKVVNAEIPMTFYNISSDLGNNVFCVNDTVIILPDEQYTEVTLTAAINNQLVLSGYGDLVYQIVNKRSQFTNNNITTNYQISFNVSAQGALDTQHPTYKLGWLLGYRDSRYILTPAVTNTSQAFVDLLGPRYLYLVVDEFKNGNPYSFTSLLQESAVNSTQILARFAMNPDSYPYGILFPARGGYIASDVRKYTGTVNLQRFNIKLVNERGVPMNLNGMDFSFCMVATHE